MKLFQQPVLGAGLQIYHDCCDSVRCNFVTTRHYDLGRCIGVLLHTNLVKFDFQLPMLAFISEEEHLEWCINVQ